MKTRDLEKFRKILLNQKAGLLNKSVWFKEENQKSKEMSGDEIDHATSEIHMSLDIRMHERERVLIQKIETALSKMAVGNYGYCEDCEEPLDLKRLEARPVATLCIACKEDQEDREKFYALS
jgi:DnaK suppressor protein